MGQLFTAYCCPIAVRSEYFVLRENVSLVKICLITLTVNLKLHVIKLCAVTAFEYFHCMQSIALIVLIVGVIEL